MSSVVTSVVAVFSAMLEWFSTALGSVSDIFYVKETGLTFIGTISVIALSISVVLLVVNMIRRFLQQH